MRQPIKCVKIESESRTKLKIKYPVFRFYTIYIKLLKIKEKYEEKNVHKTTKYSNLKQTKNNMAWFVTPCHYNIQDLPEVAMTTSSKGFVATPTLSRRG